MYFSSYQVEGGAFVPFRDVIFRLILNQVVETRRMASLLTVS